MLKIKTVSTNKIRLTKALVYTKQMVFWLVRKKV